jgi:methionyl-tRNA formyltransferase
MGSIEEEQRGENRPVRPVGQTGEGVSKTSLVFFGNERLATGVNTEVPTLQALIEAGYDIEAVVSNYERGTSRSARELEIQKVANEYDIPILLPEKPANIIDQLRDLKAEAAVLVAYGRIVPQSIIDIFPKGIINIHPSLLPLHRGSTPIESVILSGSKITGVSIMQLTKAMDAGPIFGQSEVTLTGQETKQELADHLLEVGSRMVIELLPGILNGSVIAKPQDDSAATYDKMISKEDGKITKEDLINKSAEEIEREIRAYGEWPKSLYIAVDGERLIITKAQAIRDDQNNYQPGEFTPSLDGNLLLTTKSGHIKIERLKPEGRKEMTAKDYWNGLSRS